jgi:hypothetical protein
VIAAQGVPQISKEELQQKLEEMTGRMSAAGCPVTFTSAALTPYLMLTHTESERTLNGGLDLGYRNSSGKEIYSMNLNLHILAKKSVYDLAGTDIVLPLTVYGGKSADMTVSELRHLRLPQGVHPAVISSIDLQQVFFEDGTVWMAKNSSGCSFSPNGAQVIAAR